MSDVIDTSAEAAADLQARLRAIAQKEPALGRAAVSHRALEAERMIGALLAEREAHKARADRYDTQAAAAEVLKAERDAAVAEVARLREAETDAFNNGMDEGATRAIKSLARWLDVKEWEGGDGTETWDGDVSVEIGNVLAEADLYDEESGAVATHAMIAEARAKALEEAQQVARRVPIPCECSPAEAHGRMTGALAAAEAIRALKEKTT